MPWVGDARTLYDAAYRGGYALPAFNVCSVEMIRACVDAAEELDAPLLLQTYPADLDQIAAPHVVALVRSFAEQSPVPISVHLDHGPDAALGLHCLRSGYGSIMLDGAGLDFEELIATARALADVAHAQGAALEVAAESFGGAQGEATLTEPNHAARLAHEGGADVVAVSVGSEHGQASRLDLELLAEIQDAVDGPLVLHGGSGIDEGDLAAACSLGVVARAKLRACGADGAAETPTHRP